MLFSNDITFCVHTECTNKKCRRNQCNVIGNPVYLSIADFENTEECSKNKPLPYEYLRLRNHIGHNIECVCYGRDNDDPVNISIECIDCNEVLYSVNKEEE